MPGAPSPTNASRRVFWHTLEPDEVARELASSPEGLSRDEAGRRLERDGPNELAETPPTSPLVVLLHQFRSPLIYILLAATVVTLLLEEFIDAGVIGTVLLLNAIIGFTQERKAEQSVRALMRLMAPHARVIRDGRESEVESRELVTGDLVLLESGARVPADLRLIATTALRVDESLLTGESLPVTKTTPALTPPERPLADRTNMVYMGTVVSSGRGRGYVVATAAETELGTIAHSIRGEGQTETPLQHRMTRFAHVIGIAVAISASLAFAIGVALGQSPADMFMVAVALAVSAVPEGLPVVFTITLALAVRRMARRNAIVRRLPAVETLGSTTVIGSDKTGTLTENRMTVREIWAAGQTITLDAHLSPAGARDPETPAVTRDTPLGLTLLAGVLTNEAELYRQQGVIDTHGDPTEAALLVAAATLGLEPVSVRGSYPVIEELPFEPERQYSASIRLDDGNHVMFVKGAPERVLEMSTRWLSDDGMAPLDREAVLHAAREMARRGLRVLGMAYRALPGAPKGGVVPAPEHLIFLGLQGMLDPPRAGVREAIAGCQNAGIRVVMITGDHAETAMSIGSQLGIATAGAPPLTGAELERLDDEQLRARVPDVAIFARVAPEHKLRVVQALRANGEVVAVTGDGVNDAPALKSAEIGIAMGRSGTDVAREASDMVLADDNFVSIYAAVEEGRVTFDNLRKVTFFLVSTGAAEVMMILTALTLGWPLPLVAAQILWLNLVTNGLQDVALAFEPGEPGVLDRPPRPRSEGVMSRLLWERTVVAGFVMAAGTLALFQWELAEGASLVRAQTVALTTMVVFQMFHVGNCRSDHRSVFSLSPISNPFLFVATTAALLIHLGALHFRPTQIMLRVEPLEIDAWLRIVAVALTIIVAIELHKLVRRDRRRAARAGAPAVT
ncbi:MAG TPA: HAD-IC family P-type ATPase [Vicinamibacterales bacterium]|nr:HAD-IC family P-type ATPase [Vicinamibacterales bacterium]